MTYPMQSYGEMQPLESYHEMGSQEPVPLVTSARGVIGCIASVLEILGSVFSLNIRSQRSVALYNDDGCFPNPFEPKPREPKMEVGCGLSPVTHFPFDLSIHPMPPEMMVPDDSNIGYPNIG